MAARLWILAVLFAMAGLAGCGSTTEPGPPAIDGIFPPSAELPVLPFRIADQTGLVRAVSVGNPGETEEGVRSIPGRDDALSVIWIGGMCDRRVLVTLDRSVDGLDLDVATERDFGGCRLAGVIRHLVIDFTGPVDASTVSLSVLD